MAKKKAMRRFISARSHCNGRVWQYRVPNYIGKVSVGDTVVIADPHCREEMGLAIVVSVDPCAIHQPDNIWPIVDKVKTGKWRDTVDKASTRNYLMREMAFRQSELDALSRFSASAENDRAMEEMLGEYGNLA